MEIFDKKSHRSMGRIPVSMLVNAVVEWAPTSASVDAEGEWLSSPRSWLLASTVHGAYSGAKLDPALIPQPIAK